MLLLNVLVYVCVYSVVLLRVYRLHPRRVSLPVGVSIRSMQDYAIPVTASIRVTDQWHRVLMPSRVLFLLDNIA